MENIAVFCGSNLGDDIEYLNLTRHLAHELVNRNLGVVYGGGNVGLMGALANEVLNLGGKIIGVIPEKLAGAEIAHKDLTQLHVVKTMHERKALMAELSDGFIALPGGIGTLEEIIEVLTWTQLGFHYKPCGLLNVKGFYDKLGGFLDDMLHAGFLSRFHHNMLHINTSASELLDLLENQKIIYQPKWIK